MNGSSTYLNHIAGFFFALVGNPYKDMLVAFEWKVTDMTGQTGECAAIQREQLVLIIWN
jgi:hypothetical protein